MTDNHHPAAQHPSFLLGFIVGGIVGTGMALYQSEKDRTHLRSAFQSGVKHIMAHIPELLDEFVLTSVDSYQKHHPSSSSQNQLPK